MSRPRLAAALQGALLQGNGLARRLIVALVLFSSLVTTVITAFELWLNYRRDVRAIDRSLEFVTVSSLPSLVESVWVADGAQLQTQIDGLLRLPDVERIEVLVDGRVRWASGQAASARQRVAEVPMVHPHRGQPTTIATLRVAASIDRVLQRRWDELVVVLASNAVKTVLVAGFMLVVFQWLVTRHLAAIAAFVRRIDPELPQGERLRLDRPAAGRWRPDILDAVAGAVDTLSTSLRESASRLRRSDERLRSLTREASAYIYELDAEGRIVFVNRAYPGSTAERLLGSALEPWYPADVQPLVRRAVAGALAGGGPQRFECTLPAPGGGSASFVVTVAPVPHPGERPTLAVTAIDVTELKQAEREIRELNRTLEERVRKRTNALERAAERAARASRAKSEFLSGMSHELRTPLNAVIGFSHLIERDRNAEARLVQWAREIGNAGRHLLHMIDELLDLARIEAGKVTVQPEALALPPLLDEALAIVQPLLAERRLTLERSDELPAGTRVQADRLRLRQVLVNLLSNAAKYNRPQGRITLSCRPQGDGVRITVTDTGEGIAPDALGRLFRPFERLGAEKGRIEGSGIGLALSRQLAELMGAQLGVASTVGVGSSFWIDLPPADTAAGTAAAAATPAPAPSPAPDITFDVLYIEDNEANRALVRDFLAHYPGIRLRTAADGVQGLAAARQQRPDIVLLDLHLPGIDGYEVLRRLRADPALAGVPVVAMSADAMPAQVQRGLEAGFARYLAKPVDLEMMLRTMAALLPPRPAA